MVLSIVSYYMKRITHLQILIFAAFNFYMILRKLYLPLLFLLSFSALHAQKASVRGLVYLEKTGEPAIFTNVYLKGTVYGTTTDDNGFFNLTNIPLGEYTLMVTSIGYDTAQTQVLLDKNGQIVNKKLFVNESSIQINQVTIDAKKQEAQKTVQMSVTKLTPKTIKQMPSIGGQADLAQYLQVLPGVIFTGDQGGQLYIRGGSPIQNKVLLDGMIIYNPFHSIGLFSVFDTDILRTADVYTGGFSAEYGGRISSIMDIKTKDGNKNRFAGKVAASTFGAKTLLEGPLSKPKTKNGGSKTFVLSVKNSYLDQTAPELYPDADTAGLPYNFTDLYGKISLNGSNGSKVNFFGFNFRDQVQYPNVAGFEWTQSGGGSNFVLIPARSTTIIDGTVAFTNYEINSQENELTAEVRDRRSLINGFNAGMNFTNFRGDNESKFGFELLGFKTDFSFVNSVAQRIEQIENTTEIATYFQYRFNFGKLVVEPSIRFHYYASLSTFSPEPRLGFKYNITDNLRLKGAGGLYSQNLLSATSDRDVVNLFYGFLSGPDNLQDEFTSEEGEVRAVDNPLQRAAHAIFGFEYDFKRNINVNVEGYYKKFTQLTNLNRNKLYDDDPEIDQPDVLKKEYIVEDGSAYGVDVAIKYDRKQMSLWAVYSWSYVDRWDGFVNYNPIWDRRHNVNLVGSYQFGKDLVWTADARWNIGSGFPLTQTAGFYERLSLQGSIDQDITATNGQLGVLFGDLNGGRMPWYHRFDVSLKRRVVLTEHSIMEVTASITNIYNRENIFYVNRVTNERINQLPFLPSLGLSLTF
ncbi:MAG: TonB-dependent receptor [Verrucomicrobia bacterium]|nr:TonB-dependent receptor [Verrucomicrobiota bacterium]